MIFGQQTVDLFTVARAIVPTNIIQYIAKSKIGIYIMIVVQCLQEIPCLGSTIQWKIQQASFPTGMVGPWFGIFLSPLNTNDGFYYSHIAVPACGKDKNKQLQVDRTLDESRS